MATMKTAFHRSLAVLLLLPLACSKSSEPPQAEEPAAVVTPSLSEEVSLSTPEAAPSTAPDASAKAAEPASQAATKPEPVQALDLSGGSEKEGLHYVLDDLKGTVQIIPKGSAKPETAQEEDSVEEGDTVVTGAGSEATLTLNEDTLFKLSENSKVVIGKLVPHGEQGFWSRLRLLGGKVLSEVEKLTETRSTFEIEAGGVVCGVRGTAFEVVNTGSDVQTNTFHGLVEVKEGTRVQNVGADEALAFSFTRRAFQAKRVVNAQERRRYTAWRDHQPKVRERVARRAELFRDASRLPASDRARIFQESGREGRRNRVRGMRERYLKMREQGNLPDHRSFRPGERRGKPGEARPNLRPGQDRMRERLQDRKPQRDSMDRRPEQRNAQPRNDRRLDRSTLRRKDPATAPAAVPQAAPGQAVLPQGAADRKERGRTVRERKQDRTDRPQMRNRPGASKEKKREVAKEGEKPKEKKKDVFNLLAEAAAKKKEADKASDGPGAKPGKNDRKKKRAKPGEKDEDPGPDPSTQHRPGPRRGLKGLEHPGD
jgi:hypothetical protein